MITPTATNPALTTRLSLMRIPPTRTWARRLARRPDDMRVGSTTHVHVEGFACVSRGLRAHSGVNVRTRNVAVGSLPPGPGARQCARATHTPGNCPKRRLLRHWQPVVSVFHRGGLRCGRHTTANRDLTATKRGGIALHGGPTRRRHAARRLRVVQTPHRHQPEVRRIAHKSWAQHRLARKNSPNTAPPAALPRKNSPNTSPPVTFPRKSSPSTP